MRDGIRYVAVDLDGTVLIEDRGISERTIAAFAELKKRGLVPLVATGRPRRSTLRWASLLGVVSGLVCHNGAVVYDATASVLAETTIPEKTARALVLFARGIPTHFHGFAGDEWLYETVHEGTARYEHRSGFAGRRVEWALVPELRFHKAMFVATEGEAPEIASKLRAEFGDDLEVYPTGSGFVEVVAPGIGKGKSLAILVESLGGRMDEVLAFGDAWNDEDLLVRAGIGVAMGNAPKALRDKIGTLAPAARDDGVAVWLEDFLSRPS